MITVYFTLITSIKSVFSILIQSVFDKYLLVEEQHLNTETNQVFATDLRAYHVLQLLPRYKELSALIKGSFDQRAVFPGGNTEVSLTYLT